MNTSDEEPGVSVRIVLGRSRLSASEAGEMSGGDVVQLDRGAGDPLELYTGQRLVARGQAVVVGSRWGLRVTEIV